MSERVPADAAQLDAVVFYKLKPEAITMVCPLKNLSPRTEEPAKLPVKARSCVLSIRAATLALPYSNRSFFSLQPAGSHLPPPTPHLSLAMHLSVGYYSKQRLHRVDDLVGRQHVVPYSARCLRAHDPKVCLPSTVLLTSLHN
jgi:hypothetical protein